MAHGRKALISHVFWLLKKTLVSSSLRRSSVLIPRPHSDEDQACDGQNCTETMQVHDAGEKFHDEDLSFDRNSVDDCLVTMAEELDHMHRSCRVCG